MKKLICLLSFTLLFFQSFPCYATSDDSINLSIGPDTTSFCHQYKIDFAIAENSTLGAMASYNCVNRPDFPTNGNMTMNSQVTNTFNRLLFPWRYSPHGAFHDGYFLETMAGMENGVYKSAAGSSSNVTFFDIGMFLGYQWFWSNGFNISAQIGVAHLMQFSQSKNIVPTESASAADFLNSQSGPDTHLASGVVLGWAF
jgi:hypothetical protein